MFRKNRNIILALVVLGFSASIARAAVQVGAIRVGQSAQGAEVRVSTGGNVAPRLESLTDRLVVTIPDATRASMKNLEVGAHGIRGIRFGQNEKDLRLVIDLLGPTQAKLLSADEKGFVLALNTKKMGNTPKAVSADSTGKKADAVVAAEKSAPASLDPALASYTYRVVDLSLGGDEEHGELVISSDGPASYKTQVKEDGRLVSITFRNCSLAWASAGKALTDPSIKSVSARQIQTQGETQVRIDIVLNKKLPYAINRDQNQLLVRVDRPEPDKDQADAGSANINALVSLNVENAELVGLLRGLCQQAGFDSQFSKELIAKPPPDSLVTLKISNRPMAEVFQSVLAAHDATYDLQGNLVFFGGQSDIDARRKNQPSIVKYYTPRYVAKTPLIQSSALFLKRDNLIKDTQLVLDPTNKERLMIVGTADQVAKIYSSLLKFDVPAAGEQAAGDSGVAEQTSGGSIKTKVWNLQYLDPKTSDSLIKDSINQMIPAGTLAEDEPRVLIHQQSRTLVVTASLGFINKVQKLLDRIDVRPTQVNIEGRIVEINQTAAQQLGIAWSAKQTQNNANQASFDGAIAPLFLSQIRMATIQNGYNIEAVINAMVSKQDAEVLSSPNITTNDNLVARIETTDTLALVQAKQTITNGIVVTDQVVSTFSIPLSLEVTPLISRADRRVLMKITFKLTSASGPQPAAGVPPPTSQQSADTNVNVNSGETAVIGGLVRQSNLEEERKVPFLGDIPLLGMLFRQKSQSKEKKEVIIFITPTIVED